MYKLYQFYLNTISLSYITFFLILKEHPEESRVGFEERQQIHKKVLVLDPSNTLYIKQ